LIEEASRHHQRCRLRELVADLRSYGDLPLARYLEEADRDLAEQIAQSVDVR
jgi:hypothetical protein